jgi:hypothetical protein
MTGSWQRASFAVLPVPSQGVLVGQVDMNSDGVNDMLWMAKVSGQTLARVSYMDATGAVTSVRQLGLASEVWDFVGAGDMNGDGSPDLLWQHSETGQLISWNLDRQGNVLSYMTIVESMMTMRTQIINNGSATIGRNSSTMASYRVMAVVDMNGDGHDDIIWQGVAGSNVNTVIWYLDGTGRRITYRVLVQLPSQWQIGTVADYTGDGIPDVVWYSAVTRQAVGWTLNATQQRTQTTVLASGLGDWKVANWR